VFIGVHRWFQLSFLAFADSEVLQSVHNELNQITQENPMATDSTQKTAADLLAVLDQLFGLHPGFRAVHAKGAICSGVFTPTPAAAELTRAPHANRPSTPVHVRLSDFAGVPMVPDNDPEGASPRGIAVRFHLGPHVHTDLVGHSANGFPARTGEEFGEFARAMIASRTSNAKPSPIEQFLGSHPAALKFVMVPKPFPTSFARESFYMLSAFRFTNAGGETQFGRYIIRPEAGNEYLSDAEAAKKSANFLFDELAERLSKAPIKFRIFIQLATGGDQVDDATVQWPDSREEVEFGTITLVKLEDQNEPELRKMIWDPRPGVDGIEASQDPLFEVRAAIYLLSGRRRRAAVVK
jgi:catalase